MNNFETGKINKIIDNKNGTFTFEIITTPSLANSYSNTVFNIGVIFEQNEANTGFKVGDLVKFDKDNLSNISKLPTNDFDFLEINAFIEEAKNSDSAKIKQLHSTLVGIRYSNCGTIVAADEYFIHDLLKYNCRKSEPVEMPEELIKFFNSTYMSNYYKSLLKEYIDLQTFTEILKDKDLKDLTGAEWNTLYELINTTESTLTVDKYCKTIFLPLIFQINSKGATDFLNNYVDPILVIKHIITTSGLKARPNYYSARGTNIGDLNEHKLFSIFLKLEKLNPNKALAMAKLVYSMPTLGATEFLNSLYKLVANNYELEEWVINNGNIENIGENINETLALTLISYANSLSAANYRDEYLTQKIKLKLINLQDKYLTETDLNRTEEKDEDVPSTNGQLLHLK